MVKVKDVMKKNVVTVGPEMTMSTIAKIMTNNRIGSVVVIKENKPVSIITTNDIVTLVAGDKDPKKIKVKDFEKRNKRPFLTVSPNENVLSVTKKMIKSGVQRFPVVEGNKLLGIISTKEILLVSPELIEVLSEKLKARVAEVAHPEQIISGICEYCGAYSDELRNFEGRWLCQECTEKYE